jgi:hypothetical protein
MRTLGLAFLVGVVPLVLAALRALAERDYVAGGLLVFAAAAVGHLGLEVVAIAEARLRVSPAPEEDA